MEQKHKEELDSMQSTKQQAQPPMTKIKKETTPMQKPQQGLLKEEKEQMQEGPRAESQVDEVST